MSYASGDSIKWDGIAVAKTNVKMSVRLADGREAHGSGDFDPQPRGWDPWQLTAAPDSQAKVRGRMPDSLRGAKTLDSLVLANYAIKDLELGDIPTAQVPSGPNKGIVYVTDRPNVPATDVWFHPDLLPTAAFYQKQIGPHPICTQGKMDTLWREMRRHEGMTRDPNPDSSHWAISNQLFASQRPERRSEKMYSTDTIGGRLKYDVLVDFGKWRDGPHNAQQKQWEPTDYARVKLRLNKCEFDFK